MVLEQTPTTENHARRSSMSLNHQSLRSLWLSWHGYTAVIPCRYPYITQLQLLSSMYSCWNICQTPEDLSYCDFVTNQLVAERLCPKPCARPSERLNSTDNSIAAHHCFHGREGSVDHRFIAWPFLSLSRGILVLPCIGDEGITTSLPLLFTESNCHLKSLIHPWEDSLHNSRWEIAALPRFVSAGILHCLSSPITRAECVKPRHLKALFCFCLPPSRVNTGCILE